jgi:hypothetical protein
MTERDGFARAVYRKTRTGVVRSSNRAPFRITDRLVISFFRHDACCHSDFPHKPMIEHGAAHAGMPEDARRSLHSMKPISSGTDRASTNLINKTEETRPGGPNGKHAGS